MTSSQRSADDPALEQFSYRLRKWLVQRGTSSRGADQHRLLSETEWDVLVVLDACRFDVCQRIANWPVDRVTSPASCTPDWLEQISRSGVFEGCVVLSANAQYDKVDFDGADVSEYWRTNWTENLQTVLPESILDGMTDRLQDGGDSIVAHLQQPHWPYVARIDESWQLAYRDVGPWDSSDGEIQSLQVSMARGKVDAKKAQAAYTASVRSIWKTLVPYVDDWVTSGHSVVVTADHGETFGRFSELGLYEHPCKCHIDPLTSVPWVEFRPADSDVDAGESGDLVRERLQALGYAE